MYWFVIYTARLRTRARVKAPHVGPPDSGSWFKCPAPVVEPGNPLARYTTVLAERGWRELCEELGLDLERACREGSRCQVCEAGSLPAIAVELTARPRRKGEATDLEAGLCVAPLPESDAERERARSLFAEVAFNVGGSDAELRCPDCASPELRWLGGSDPSEQMCCGNCGARLAREAAFLCLGDCEEILAAAPSPALVATVAASVHQLRALRRLHGPHREGGAT
ncbi:MAG TPA: hypothetical protein VF245_00875 [Solirubrobacterales bacterium]